VRGGSERQDEGWWISPAIPTIANVVLGALWAFSAFGGWGRTAFCQDSGPLDQGCSSGFDTTIMISLVPALLATLLAAGAWLIPAVRRDPTLLDTLLTIAALSWVVAQAVLFLGGYLVQP
jgi:hypothetical protein